MLRQKSNLAKNVALLITPEIKLRDKLWEARDRTDSYPFSVKNVVEFLKDGQGF